MPEVPTSDELPRDESEIDDDQLRLIFTCACAAPQLSRPDRVALTLQLVCGFGAAEVARAFLTPRATIAQRLVRAKRRIREAGLPFEIPAPAELPGRLEAVTDVLYQTFNQGYTCHDGDQVLRTDVTDEAIRLTGLLARRPVGDRPHVHALLALMLLQSSRLAARLDAGRLVPLEEQDRSRWDRARIHAGMNELARAATGPSVSEYHLLAGIACCHATATDFDSTDWTRILALYDDLAERVGGFVVRLNRAVALSMVEGPDAGLAELDDLEPQGAASHLVPAARAELHRRLGRLDQAREEYVRAAGLAPSEAERRFLESRAAACRSS